MRSINNKKVRKHKGIHQAGGKRGRLKKGYKYSGQRTKSGLPIILKVNKSKKQYNQRGGTPIDIIDFLQDRLLNTNIIDNNNVLWDHLAITSKEGAIEPKILEDPKQDSINWFLNQKYISENQCHFVDIGKVKTKWYEIINKYRQEIINEIDFNFEKQQMTSASIITNKLKQLMKSPKGLEKISKVIDLINIARDDFMNVKIAELVPENRNNMPPENREMLSILLTEYTTIKDLHQLYIKNWDEIKDQAKEFLDKFWNSDEIKKIKNHELETKLPIGQYKIKINNIDDFANEFKRNNLYIEPRKPKLVRSQSFTSRRALNQIQQNSIYSEKYLKDRNAFIKKKITEQILPLFSNTDEMRDITPMSFIHHDIVIRLIYSLGLITEDGELQQLVNYIKPNKHNKLEYGALVNHGTLVWEFESNKIAKHPNIRAAFCTNISKNKTLKPIAFNMFTIFHEIGHEVAAVKEEWPPHCNISPTVNIGDKIVKLEKNVNHEEIVAKYKKMLKTVREEHPDLKDKDDKYIEDNDVLNQFFNAEYQVNITILNDLMADIMSVVIYMKNLEDKKFSDRECVESLIAILDMMTADNTHFHKQIRKIWNFVINKNLYKYYKKWRINDLPKWDEKYNTEYQVEYSNSKDIKQQAVKAANFIIKQHPGMLWASSLNSGWKSQYHRRFELIKYMTPKQQDAIIAHYADPRGNVEKNANALLKIINNDRGDVKDWPSADLPQDFIKKARISTSITLQNKKQAKELKNPDESSKNGGKRKTKRIANLKISKKGGKRKTKK